MWISRKRLESIDERIHSMNNRIAQLENDVRVNYYDTRFPMLGSYQPQQPSVKLNTLIEELAEKLGYTIKKNVVHKEEYLEKIEKKEKNNGK